MRRRATGWAVFGVVALVILAAAVRCGDNLNYPLLDPSTGTPNAIVAEGVLSGVLFWGDGAPAPPYPTTVVYALRSYDDSCTGGPTSIHVTGVYNGWDTSTWESEPGMTEIFPCYWVEAIDLAPEEQFAWKFVTSKSWDGSYASGGGSVDATARRGTTTPDNGGDLQVSIPSAGEYWFLLNASGSPGLFQIATGEEVPWDTTGGSRDSFSIDNLESGLYTLVIHVPDGEEDFPVSYRRIRISGDQGVDLGVVRVILTGEIRGTLAFADSPPATPPAEIYVSVSSTGVPVDTVSLDAGETEFSLTSLLEDEYDLWIHTASYVDTVLTDVEFVLGREIDLGTITLARGGAVSGTVALSDDPGSRPAISVFYENPATGDRLARTVADGSDGSFLLDGVPPGLREIGFEARRYRDTTLVDVVIAAAETTDVGTVTLDPGCVSVATTIHLLGEFNGWNEGLFNSDPGMIQSESCLWRDTVDLFPSILPDPEFKFVTDKAYASPPDYGLCDGAAYGSLTGPICLIGPGPPLNLVLTDAGTPGRYAFKLDEDSLIYRATLLEEFTGSVTGTIAYDTGLLPPFPAASVTAKRASDSLVLATVSIDPGTGAFAVTGLPGGTFIVEISGSNFRDTLFTGIVVPDGGAVDLGTITVTEVVFQSEFTVIRVVGDFNNWDVGRPSMKQIEPGVWVDTITVAARPPDNCHFMKFRTANDWGANDYHNCGDQDNTCSAPLTGPVCTNTGNSDPPALGKMRLDPGTYEFRLDEVNRTYAVTLIP
ncbi:MAG: hypothetical protein ABIK65_13860 [Candidatus Eisenbacteria bacterium]